MDSRGDADHPHRHGLSGSTAIEHQHCCSWTPRHQESAWLSCQPDPWTSTQNLTAVGLWTHKWPSCSPGPDITLAPDSRTFHLDDARCSMAPVLQHGPWWPIKLQATTQSLVATGVRDVDSDSGCCSTTNPDKRLAVLDSTCHQISVASVVARLLDILMANGGSLRHWACLWPFMALWAMDGHTDSGHQLVLNNISHIFILFITKVFQSYLSFCDLKTDWRSFESYFCIFISCHLNFQCLPYSIISDTYINVLFEDMQISSAIRLCLPSALVNPFVLVTICSSHTSRKVQSSL